MFENRIICGDCLKILPTLPKARMIFADPPDNLGLKYNGFTDRQERYLEWLSRVMLSGWKYSDIFWLSFYHKYLAYVVSMGGDSSRLFIWRFTFGQHRESDCGNGFRPILRIIKPHTVIYPDAIRIPSARQTVYGDKRANPEGRVPDDVWDFPRVCGTFKERSRWHPCQHPEALIERIVKLSTKEGDLVIDMFAGRGTVNRVCKRLNRHCIGIEISQFYCDKIEADLCKEQK